MNKDLSILEKNIGVTFNNRNLLEVALTHRSFLNENKGTTQNNERLEFLGDAVLELIVSDYLFTKYTNRPEGELTSFRSALVKTESLAETAKTLEYGKYLRLSRGEEETGGREKDYLLANTFEAVLGAIYLDRGYDISKDFVSRILLPKMEGIVNNRLDIDNKTKIQELAQSTYKVTPIYEVIHEVGPDHEKTFTVVVKINDKVIGEGIGPSKQKAEERAAQEGVEYIKSHQ